MADVTLAVVVVGVVGAVAALAWSAADRWQALPVPERRAVLATGALIALAVTARLWLVTPGYLHANLHGPALADAALAWPRLDAHRATYGPVGFFLLGGIAHSFGGGWEGLVRANALAGGALLATIAWVATRWAGTVQAAPIAVALGALLPGLALVSASEDVHPVATALALASVALFDTYGRDRRAVHLVAGCLLASLAAHSRQTLVPLALLAPLWAAMRTHDLVRDWRFQAAGAVVVAAVTARVAATLADRGDQVTFDLVPLLFADPVALAPVFAHHPLTAPAHAALLLPLALWGAVQLWRHDRAGWAIVGGLCGLTALTLPLGVPIAGNELGFRLPVTALAVAVAALALVPWTRRQGLAGRSLGIAALAAHGLLLPALYAPRRVAPMDSEREHLQHSAAWLGPAPTFAVLPVREPAPSYWLPRHALPAGARTVVATPDAIAAARRPVHFLSGLRCRAWSGRELAAHAGVPTTALALVWSSYAGQLPPGVVPSDAVRPECLELLRGAIAVGPATRIARPYSELPFAVFGSAPLVVQVYRLAATGSTGLPTAPRQDIAGERP
ncbi:MAG: hypothetical protein EXR79_12495 [Myxococcales bacterium]|nr:hypothetical protein [Myxococcales bacterium]